MAENTGKTLLNAEIRPMTEADIPAVASLESRLFSDPWSETEIRRSFANDSLYRYYVAGGAEGILGYACMSLILDEMNVDNLAVDASCRRRGLARALMLRMLRDAREAGMTAATLEVRDSNAPAIALYESFGFRQIGFRKDYYVKPAEGARIYAKALQEEEP